MTEQEKPKKTSRLARASLVLAPLFIPVFFIGTIFISLIAESLSASIADNLGYSEFYVQHRLTLGILALFPLSGILLGLAAIIRHIISKRKKESLAEAIFGIFLNYCIIALIIIPNPIKYACGPVKYDPKKDLESLHKAQEVYHSEHGYYSETFKELEWSPPNPRWYAFYLSPNEVIQPKMAGPYSLPDCLEPFVEKDKFYVVAVGDVDKDEVLDGWYIDHEGIMKNFINDCKFIFWNDPVLQSQTRFANRPCGL